MHSFVYPVHLDSNMAPRGPKIPDDSPNRPQDGCLGGGYAIRFGPVLFVKGRFCLLRAGKGRFCLVRAGPCPPGGGGQGGAELAPTAYDPWAQGSADLTKQNVW